MTETTVKIADLIGDVKPATDRLIAEIAEQVRDRREHDHDSAADWDWYCLNASGWLGDRMSVVLRRLLDAEAEVARLTAENEALETGLGLNEEEPQTVARGLSAKEAAFRLMAETSPVPANAARFALAADKERGAVIAAAKAEAGETA
jgi:hypothetical protein